MERLEAHDSQLTGPSFLRPVNRQESPQEEQR